MEEDRVEAQLEDDLPEAVLEEGDVPRHLRPGPSGGSRRTAHGERRVLRDVLEAEEPLAVRLEHVLRTHCLHDRLDDRVEVALSVERQELVHREELDEHRLCQLEERLDVCMRVELHGRLEDGLLRAAVDAERDEGVCRCACQIWNVGDQELQERGEGAVEVRHGDRMKHVDNVDGELERGEAEVNAGCDDAVVCLEGARGMCLPL